MIDETSIKEPDKYGPMVVDTIQLRQDVGMYEPKFKRVDVELMSDGTMRWTKVTTDVGF